MIRILASISGFTLVSRITGLVRETLVAALFGASPLTDAFFVAFRIPNLFRRLFAEGAFSQVFIPAVAAMRKQGDEAALRFANVVGSGLFWLVGVLAIVGVFAAPALVWLIGSGLDKGSEAFTHASNLTQMMFPYIFFMSMVAMMSGVLNSWEHFHIPAFTPVLLNLAMIAAMLLLHQSIEPPIYSLAVGVVVGGILQYLFVLYGMRRHQLHLTFEAHPRTVTSSPEVRGLLKRMGPAIFALSVSQISLIINTNIATHLQAGSVSWLSYADRVMELPSALLGVALATLLLPKLARAEGTLYIRLLDWGLRLACLLVLPATVALITLGEAVSATLFHYGRFAAADVEGTRLALLGYGLGLWALITLKVLVSAFYARGDIKTPVKVALVSLVLTQLANLLLVPGLAHLGLALSISIGAIVNNTLLWFILWRRGICQLGKEWYGFIARLLLALLVFSLVSFYLGNTFDWVALRDSPWQRIALLVGVMLLSVLSYGLMLFALGFRLQHFQWRGEGHEGSNGGDAKNSERRDGRGEKRDV